MVPSMIGLLRGKLLEKHPPFILVDLQGIGYEVAVPMSTLFQLPETDEEITLYCHFVVREDAQLLYGFHQRRDRDLFRLLIKVNGIGPKIGLAILSSMDGDTLIQCIQTEDNALLTQVPGIGKKTAERLLIEMRDRIKDSALPQATTTAGANTLIADSSRAKNDAISALIALGYKPTEASKAVTSVYQEEHNSETLIRLALQK